MFLGSKLFLVITAVALIGGAPSVISADDQLTGVVVGRTGEILHISVPQPVHEGALFAVKLLESERPIADARVLTCTQERPFLVLAKVVRGDIGQPVPIGVRAYADSDTLSRNPGVPAPMVRGRPAATERFSIQVGAFYPSEPLLRDTTADLWQAYRLNYSVLSIGGVDTQLSVEYTRGSGSFTEGEQTGTRTMEIIPVTLLGRFRPISLGSAKLFFAAGAGLYEIRSAQKLAGAVTRTRDSEFGHELGVGLESSRGWIMELRHRDILDTDIKGYCFTVGARF